MYEKKTSRNWVQSLGKNLTWRWSNSCIYHSISYNVSFINHPPHNLAIPVFLCLETQSFAFLPCLRAWPWESRVFKAITMEFLRQVSVLFFIVGIFCDDGLVISNLLFYLENRIYIFLSCAFHIYTGFLSFSYRVLDIEFPSLSVNAPQNGDIILQVTFNYINIFF